MLPGGIVFAIIIGSLAAFFLGLACILCICCKTSKYDDEWERSGSRKKRRGSDIEDQYPLVSREGNNNKRVKEPTAPPLDGEHSERDRLLNEKEAELGDQSPEEEVAIQDQHHPPRYSTLPGEKPFMLLPPPPGRSKSPATVETLDEVDDKPGTSKGGSDPENPPKSLHSKPDLQLLVVPTEQQLPDFHQPEVHEEDKVKDDTVEEGESEKEKKENKDEDVEKSVDYEPDVSKQTDNVDNVDDGKDEEDSKLPGDISESTEAKQKQESSPKVEHPTEPDKEDKRDELSTVPMGKESEKPAEVKSESPPLESPEPDKTLERQLLEDQVARPQEPGNDDSTPDVMPAVQNQDVEPEKEVSVNESEDRTEKPDQEQPKSREEMNSTESPLVASDATVPIVRDSVSEENNIAKPEKEVLKPEAEVEKQHGESENVDDTIVQPQDGEDEKPVISLVVTNNDTTPNTDTVPDKKELSNKEPPREEDEETKNEREEPPARPTSNQVPLEAVEEVSKEDVPNLISPEDGSGNTDEESVVRDEEQKEENNVTGEAKLIHPKPVNLPKVLPPFSESKQAPIVKVEEEDEEDDDENSSLVDDNAEIDIGLVEHDKTETKEDIGMDANINTESDINIAEQDNKKEEENVGAESAESGINPVEQDKKKTKEENVGNAESDNNLSALDNTNTDQDKVGGEEPTLPSSSNTNLYPDLSSHSPEREKREEDPDSKTMRA